jgi:two-component system, OmpR family, alkaline phosphatase synthesis response regulator PhoP
MPNRILVCDDESHITRAVSMKLQKAGFEVETASDGQAGWEAIRRQVPRLVITDYQMPRLDGIGLCRRMREHEETRHLPVILLTAKGYEMDAADLTSDNQFSAVLVKPFSPRELLRTVQQTLEEYVVSDE